MSARNYFPIREKSVNKLIDYLPNIKTQKFGYRSGHELPVLSARSSLINRNLSYSYEVQPFIENCLERAGTPYSDFFSDSETGTPDLNSEESDSSAGSALRRNTAEVTNKLRAEWDRIERTLYDEEGEKSTRPDIIEECNQWRQLHPLLRVVGKAISLPEKKQPYKQIEHDEIIAIHYSDYEQFSESDERLSQSSGDVTPQNSPRPSISDDYCVPRLSREKVSFYTAYNDEVDLNDSFCSLLQITPLHIYSPSQRRKQSSSILRSEIASSRWMRQRPDSSVNERNSAKSVVSLDTRKYVNAVSSASDCNNTFNNRVVTARNRETARLEPLYSAESQHIDISKLSNGVSYPYNVRKVSLPPLLLEEEKRKCAALSSAKKHNIKTRKKSGTKSVYQLDRARH